MPLVIPGLQSKDGKEDWSTKLMGKQLGDDHNETVRYYLSSCISSCLYPLPFPSLLSLSTKSFIPVFTIPTSLYTAK